MAAGLISVVCSGCALSQCSAHQSQALIFPSILLHVDRLKILLEVPALCLNFLQNCTGLNGSWETC